MNVLALKPERLGFTDFTDQPISICGRGFLADMSGALYWPSENALIVSDLHLGKAAYFAARGQMLPPYDTRDTLQRLAEVIEKFDADTVIALGDSFHDANAAASLTGDEKAMLDVMQEDCDWIWITGNHDPVIGPRLGGHVFSELTVEGITLRHEPRASASTHEIAGHLHPAAKVVMHGTAIRRPCFVGNGTRLVLPAFGTFTGGLNILDDAFEPLFGNDGLAVWVLGQEGLYPIASRLLRGD